MVRKERVGAPTLSFAYGESLPAGTAGMGFPAKKERVWQRKRKNPPQLQWMSWSGQR